jgi:hypothetical protein
MTTLEQTRSEDLVAEKIKRSRSFTPTRRK